MRATIRRAGQAALAVAAVSLAAATVTGPADAAAYPKPKAPVLSVTGGSQYALDASGSAVVTGAADVYFGKSMTAVPASITAVLTADDGTLPDPENCEPASATFEVTGPNRSSMTLEGTGTVCGVFPQLPTYVVTHVFTGRYDVTDASRHKLLGTDGFFEVRLGLDGVASAFAIDT